MYTEEPKREINWGNVIKKGLIVLLVAIIIILIIWLITRNNNANNINVNNGTNNNNTNEKINTNAYSKDFIENYLYYHDFAKEHFLVSSTLPTSGNTLKYTLQELINKGLILPLIYKDNKTCDLESSYVLVKNNNGKYEMTTFLSCGKETAKTTEDLGCNQLCTNGNCDNKVEDATAIEYQFKQAYKTTETVYSCPSGYTKSGSKCVKGSTSTINATKTVTYNCPKGYSKSGSGENTKCYKNGQKVVDANVNYTYSCPSGYTKSGSGKNTKCTRYYAYTVNASKSSDTYNCPSGYTKSGSGANTKCTKTTTSTSSANPIKSGGEYTCSKGTLVNTKYCRIYTTKTTYKSYSQYLGKTYNGCTYSGSYTEACSTYYGCTTTKYKYYCNTSSYTDVAATKTEVTYKCPSGYDKSGSGANTKCTKTTTKTVSANPIKTSGGYYCSTGTLTGSKCLIETTDSANYIRDKYYTCDAGYGLSGNVCYKTTSESTKPIKNTAYTCKSGYTKVGLGSSSKCTTGVTSTINATKSTKTVTKYKYQWSTKTSIAGWERTGQTRTVKASSK